MSPSAGSTGAECATLAGALAPIRFDSVLHTCAELRLVDIELIAEDVLPQARPVGRFLLISRVGLDESEVA